MKKTIISVIAGLGIALAVVPATTAVADAATIPGTGAGFATSLPVCTPWLIEHARPCLPRTTAPTHRHRHHRNHGPCHHGNHGHRHH